MVINNNFASNLKSLLAKNDLKQKEFAEEIQINRRTVSAWICGRTQPDLDTLIEIGYYFGVSLDELIK